MKALVVEDDALTRMMLGSSLEGMGFTISHITDSAVSALTYAKRNPIDFALLDLHLGKGPTGIDLAIALRKIFPSVGIVFLTSYEDPRLLGRKLPVMPTGSIYLNKRNIQNLQKLQDQIVSSTKAALGSKTVHQARSTTIGRLTDSQIETLRYMAMGLSNTEIARRRFVSDKAVELSISRLAKAVGVERDGTQNQRVQIAQIYFQALGLTLPDED